MSAIMYPINGYNMNERKGQISCYLVKGEKKWPIRLFLFASVPHQAAAVRLYWRVSRNDGTNISLSSVRDLLNITSILHDRGE